MIYTGAAHRGTEVAIGNDGGMEKRMARKKEGLNKKDGEIVSVLLFLQDSVRGDLLRSHLVVLLQSSSVFSGVCYSVGSG